VDFLREERGLLIKGKGRRRKTRKGGRMRIIREIRGDY
jgi:hypothetical protein